MVLTTGAVSPSVTPFTTTFSGPLPLPIQEPTLPEITSPPIEEDITYPPIVVRNISDNTLYQDKHLCKIELKKQNKKLQQFPLIGETAAKHQAKESKIKKWNFGENRFYTLAADCAAGCQPLTGRTPAPASQSPASQLVGDSTPPTAGLSTPAKWGNCPIGNPQKAISPNPKGGGTAAQIWNLPNLEGADKLPNTNIPALAAEVKFGCMKASNDTQNQCKPRSNNSLPSHHF
ncbi:hypothetical protein DSO57_1037941 [Entomophthora muscae]|uniref:Uncharacterized protein n=1 Tax=Entomophthora muscae TaxID=34485 RepID=A0ACC2UJ71_9FUNG|nr:hypothetical protein DSO57_1037941 [Entomophthora muscae]